jgi:hypothetical protein
MFAAVPLLALPVGLYALIALTLPGGWMGLGAQDQMTRPLIDLAMGSGGHWPISLGDVMVTSGLVLFFIELLRATDNRSAALINHSLSMLLFLLCCLGFFLLPAFTTSCFFLISVMVLLDAVAGLIGTIAEFRQDH